MHRPYASKQIIIAAANCAAAVSALRVLVKVAVRQ